MKKQLKLLPVYLNGAYLLFAILVIVVIKRQSDIFLDFRTTNTKFFFMLTGIIYWVLVISGIILNIKKIKLLILIVIMSVINFFLLKEATELFMPW